jgi:hypothetical protein
MGAQNTVGQGLELEVLAAVILGGASLLGGSGTIFKTVIGVLILGFIQNGLLLGRPAVLRPVRCDLGHHHPGRLARHRQPNAASSGHQSREEDETMDNPDILSKAILKGGAIWGFIVLELIFFHCRRAVLVTERTVPSWTSTTCSCCSSNRRPSASSPWA